MEVHTRAHVPIEQLIVMRFVFAPPAVVSIVAVHAPEAGGLVVVSCPTSVASRPATPPAAVI